MLVAHILPHNNRVGMGIQCNILLNDPKSWHLCGRMWGYSAHSGYMSQLQCGNQCRTGACPTPWKSCPSPDYSIKGEMHKNKKKGKTQKVT